MRGTSWRVREGLLLFLPVLGCLVDIELELFFETGFFSLDALVALFHVLFVFVVLRPSFEQVVVFFLDDSSPVLLGVGLSGNYGL